MSPQEARQLMRAKEQELSSVKGTTCQVYSRCVGYHSPTSNWNKGKVAEFAVRNTFKAM